MTEFFTIKVYQVLEGFKGSHLSNKTESNHSDPKEKMKFLEQFQNMISAKVMNGKILELEHSKLVGPAVKFKTVINYEQYLEPEHSLGIVMLGQDCYISPI